MPYFEKKRLFRSAAMVTTAGSIAFVIWKASHKSLMSVSMTPDVSEKDIQPPRIITLEELAKHKSESDGGIWVSYENKVYDITKFVALHPGGDKILLAAGSDLLPFWSLYAFHFEDHVLEVLKEYYIGELPPDEHENIEARTSTLYSNEPHRHPALRTVSKEPRNAETPTSLIVDHPITPTELFFVRNHHPVPDIDGQAHRLQLTTPDLCGLGSLNVSLTLEELKQLFQPHTIIATIVCAGNRRSDMIKDDQRRSSALRTKPSIRGLQWKQSAISTAEWTGVRLVDLLARYLCPDDVTQNYAKLLSLARNSKIRHVQFVGSDVDVVGGAFGASVPIEWALNPQNDILIAYEMNGKPLSRDHGFPLRVIVPGSIGARQVKWLCAVHLSPEESPSFYQQEDYKVMYPANNADNSTDHRKLPAILDYPVQSSICEPLDGQELVNYGSLTVKGYAFSGGGRGILSVRVTIDNGRTWHEATLHPVSPPDGIDPSELKDGDLALEYRCTRQWAWTLWEAEVPIPANATKVELACCARDSSNAVQPESTESNLNVRGLLTNSWHRIHIQLKPESI